VAVSEKHNAAEPNILAGGIAYQNLVASLRPIGQYGACRSVCQDDGLANEFG